MLIKLLPKKGFLYFQLHKYHFILYKIFYFAQTSSFIVSYFESPIPDIFFNSSIDLNLPFSSLYFIILSAVDGPIPVTVSSSV